MADNGTLLTAGGADVSYSNENNYVSSSESAHTTYGQDWNDNIQASSSVVTETLFSEENSQFNANTNDDGSYYAEGASTSDKYVENSNYNDTHSFADADLYSEWLEFFDDDSGLPYYYNPRTGETQWENPQ